MLGRQERRALQRPSTRSLDPFLYKQGTHIILHSNKFPLSGICFAVEQSLLQIVNLRYAGPQVKKKLAEKC
jgi:hypothetical protein